MQSLLQICEQSRELDESVVSMSEKCCGGSFTIEDLTNALGSMLRYTTNSFVALDAIDECLQEKERPQLFKALIDVKSMAKNLRVLEPAYKVFVRPRSAWISTMSMRTFACTFAHAFLMMRAQCNGCRGLGRILNKA
jgi:hypothetical protein